MDTERRESTLWMLVPEIALAIGLVWFGVATPAPVRAGVENAVGIVLDAGTDELHTSPLPSIFFGSADPTSEVE